MSFVPYKFGSVAQSALAIVAKWMGTDEGITVKYSKNSTVCVDLKTRTVMVPAVHGELDGEKLDLLRGWIYHEAGHVAVTSEAVSDEARKTPGLFNLLNLVEDRRMEKCMRARHVGVSRVFDAKLAFYNREIAGRVAKGELKGWAQAQMAMSMMVEGLTPAWSLTDDVKALVDRYYPIFAQVRDAKNTEDSLEIARQLQQERQEQKQQEQQEEQKDEEKNEEGQESEEQQQQGSEGEESDEENESDEDGEGNESEGNESDEDGKGSDDGENEDGSENNESEDGEGSEDNESEENGSESDEDSDDEDGEGSDGNESEDGEDSEGDENGESDEGGQGSEESDEDSDSEDDEDGSDSAAGSNNADEESDEDGEETDANTVNQISVSESENGDDDETPPTDVELIAAVLAPELEAACERTGYRSNPDNDVVEKVIPNPTDRAELNSLRKSLNAAAVTGRRVLETALLARTLSRKVAYLEQGKIDKARLSAVAKNLDKQIFCTVRPGQKLDTAVVLVIDESGSMLQQNLVGGKSKSQVEAAREMAIILGDCCNALGIPFAVVGASTTDQYARYDREGFDRTNPIHYREYKQFTETWSKTDLGLMSTAARRNNVDGEVLDYAARKVAARPEKRKIVMVLSDGLPDAGHGNYTTMCQHLLKVVADVRRAGIEVYGFGLATDEPRRFYGSQGFVYLAADEPMAVPFFQRFATLLKTPHKT